jgi:hypothetical protein
MKQILETQEKLNKYIMYALFTGLAIITIVSIAGTIFGIFRSHDNGRAAHLRPILEEHIPPVGGQVAVTYEYPTSDAINQMIAQGYTVETIIYDNFKDQAIVVYKRVK